LDKIGIVGYGCSIPYLRIKIEDIYEVWRNYSLDFLKERLGLNERAVLQPNEDATTLAVAASKYALQYAQLRPEQIDALIFGTCTNPYDSKSSATIISEALGLPNNLFCTDVQFSSKSGAAAVQIVMALVGSEMAKYGIAIGADTLNRHACPGRLFEYEASAGAVALLLGRDQSIADIEGAESYVSDTTDFWRCEGDRYIQSSGLSPNSTSGEAHPMWEIGYVNHVAKATASLMKKLSLKPEDFTYAVFQQPFGTAPYDVMGSLGFKEDQVRPGTLASAIGDCGSASALLGLASVLDIAKKEERIFVASYGFGAASQVFSIKTTSLVEEKKPPITVKELLENKKMVDYANAVRNEYKYLQDLNPTYL